MNSSRISEPTGQSKPEGMKKSTATGSVLPQSESVTAVAGEAEPEESRQLAAYRKKYGALRGTELSDIEQAGLSLELVELLEERCRNLEEDNEHLKNLLRCDPSDRIDDGFGNTWSRTCSTCGLGTMHINRPGEVQCDYCA